MAGLYIHIPFCHSKCSYCDFYSGLRPSSAEGYIEALIAELSLRRDEIKEPILTIYIGGGTPSVLPVADIAKLAEAIGSTFNTSAVEEFTIEVNPEDVSDSLLEAYRSIGVNRISMGVQSFDNDMLKAINRRHDAQQALFAIQMLNQHGWNYSVDLMFGLPGQSLSAWQSDVQRLMAIRPPHFSAYLLSYEPGTRLYAMLQSGKVDEASEQLASAMQEYVSEEARRHGYSHYEISNYALPGFHSRHNSAYWNMTSYLGIGASAHSYDGMVRRINPPDLRNYLSALSNGKIIAQTDNETIDELFNDFIITGLRTAQGLSLPMLRNCFPETFVADLLADASKLIAAGQLRLSEQFLAIPEQYWLKSDAIMRELLRV